MNKLRIDSESEDLTFLEGLQAHRLSAAAGLRASAEGGIEPPLQSPDSAGVLDTAIAVGLHLTCFLHCLHLIGEREAPFHAVSCHASFRMNGRFVVTFSSF